MFTPSQKPFFYLGKFAIGITELIILLELLGMLAVVFTQGSIIPHTAFVVEGLFSGKVWQILTYPFLSSISLFFIFGLYCFYHFGRMVEHQLGRTTYAAVCLTILLGAPLIFTAYNQIVGSSASVLVGAHILHLGIFSCFCVMNPNMPLMYFGFPIKWAGLGFLIISLLTAFSAGAYDQVLIVIITISGSLLIVQSKGKSLLKLFPDSWAASTPKQTERKRKIIREAKIKPRAKTRSETKVDAILDKISEHGLHSLTEQERETLQKLRK